MGRAAVILALVATIPLIAFTIIFAIFVVLLGGHGRVFDYLFGFAAAIGPIVPAAIGVISATGLVLGVISATRAASRRDGITAIAVTIAVPLLAFLVLGVLAAF